MPTYKNANAVEVLVGSYRIPANGALITQEYLLNLPAGVTLLTATPYYNDVLLSGLYSASATVTVPTADSAGQPVEGCQITVHCVSGSYTVQWNALANTPAIAIGAGMMVQRKFRTRIVSTIELVQVAAGDVYVTIERM